MKLSICFGKSSCMQSFTNLSQTRKLQLSEWKNGLHPRIADIVWRFLCDGEDNYKKLCENLRKYQIISQYVYASVYPDVYCNSVRCDFDLKCEFQVKFKK